METKFNFKSQICTDKNQSERLLALGLKKETRDAVLKKYIHNDKYCYKPVFEDIEDRLIDCNDLHPAWSLGRLIKDLMPQRVGRFELAVGNDYAGYYEDRYNSEFGMYWEYVEETPDMFDNIISTIEWLIKEGYFNKEYLK